MELMEAIRSRHSVRSYTDRRIEPELVKTLQAEIAACNLESGLNIQLVTEEPEAFGGLMAHYGKFSGVKNYIALVGKKGDDLDQTIGYYGERIVLKAQQLGLNTCWVALTFRKGKTRCTIAHDEKLVCVLALGYGSTQGIPHKSKELNAVCTADRDLPDWFRAGMEAALLAPTATNQQKFRFEWKDGKVFAKSTGGFYSKVDLGIVRYHFEIGAGKENFQWA
ncbi:MAG: nitroreductase family protein [Butyricicoccaceae bacterium]